VINSKSDDQIEIEFSVEVGGFKTGSRMASNLALERRYVNTGHATEVDVTRIGNI